MARLEKELHTAHTILDVQGKVAGLLGFSLEHGKDLLMAVQPLASQVGVAPACRALGVPRATFYRRRRPAPGHRQPRPAPARALCASERAHVLDVLASPRFVDRSPAEVVATLLDEGEYLCAERTMYRILAANQPVPRAAQSAQPSLLHQARAGGHGPPTRPGPGTSPGSAGPNAGRPSTSTSCSTSSAATSWAGWLPTGRMPHSPRR